MKKNIAMLRKVGGLGLAGLLSFGATNAAAETFDASASVQNALAITNIVPMNFGTLFASAANSSAAAALVLSPTGAISEGTAQAVDGGATGAAPSFLSLGGAVAAAQGTVSPSDNEFTVTVPGGTAASDLDNAVDFATTATAVDDGDVVEMIIDTGNSGVARFYLADFVLTDISGATSVDNTSAPIYTIIPDFQTDVVFGVGATIYTDGSGARTSYQQGTYVGTFEVEASF